MKKFILFILILPILSSCDTMKEAGKVLRNEKVNTTDEFLVKKREPLVLPPDYEKLPQPGERRKEEINESEKIKKILKLPQENANNKNENSSVEQSIIDKIKK